MRTSLLFLALLISAVVIEASPTSIQHKGGFGGGFGGQGNPGDGGGHGGPAYESTENKWKDRIRVKVPTFETVAGRGKFADRRLLHKGGFGGGFGGQGSAGNSGGMHGPGMVGASENAWKDRVKEKTPSFETVAGRASDKFADRRLLHKGGFGGGFGGQGSTGDGGGHGGPAYESTENAWKDRVRSSAVTFDTVSSRVSDKFADRRLMQENEVPEWRDGLAGIKQQVRSSVVGTPLPEDRFVKPQA